MIVCVAVSIAFDYNARRRCARVFTTKNNGKFDAQPSNADVNQALTPRGLISITRNHVNERFNPDSPNGIRARLVIAPFLIHEKRRRAIFRQQRNAPFIPRNSLSNKESAFT
jgi:hypothetical protein